MFVVQSLDHFASALTAKVGLVPFLFRVRISLAPTHFANQIARLIGTVLVRHCSKSCCPRMPCGIVRLSFRKVTVSLARSLSHAFLLVSVSVTRGGGLKTEPEVILWFCARCCIADPYSADRVCKPSRFLKAVLSKAGRAVFDSFHVGGCLSNWPLLTVWSFSWSSGWLPTHGKKSATQLP